MSELVFFTEQVINIWNKLSIPTVDFKSLSSFKKTISNINLAALVLICWFFHCDGCKSSFCFLSLPAILFLLSLYCICAWQKNRSFVHSFVTKTSDVGDIL